MISFDISLLPKPILILRDVLGPQTAYAVGGLIRDTLVSMGNTKNSKNSKIDRLTGQDWDIATPLHPGDVIARLRKSNITAVPIGFEHGTVAAVIDDIQYEITTFRHDIESIDGRHAKVQFSKTIQEDLARRDFTVNAFALDLYTGEILDLFHGREDVKNKIIRTVGHPLERFQEDYLRMMRAVRFAAKMNGVIEPDTFHAIQQKACLITKISPERIRDEIMKILHDPTPSYAFDLLHETGLLFYILPELEQGYGAFQNRFHADDVAHHILYSVDAVSPKYPFVRFMTLMHDLGKVPAKKYNPNKGDYVFYGHQYVSKRMLKRIMRRLRFANKKIDLASTIVENHMYNLKPDLSEGAIRRFVGKIGRDNVDAFLRMRMADRKGNRANNDEYERGIFHFLRNVRKIDREENALKIRDLKITGYDLMAIGLEPGPIFRRIMEELLEEVLDTPALNEREYLLKKAVYLSNDTDFLNKIQQHRMENDTEEVDKF
jgi:tRNA nucleotidyltransferase (CCA-adding enzyme)